MQHCKRLSVILKIWNAVLRVKVTFSSVGGGEGGLWPPYWPVNQNAVQEKPLFFSTSETGFCARID